MAGGGGEAAGELATDPLHLRLEARGWRFESPWSGPDHRSLRYSDPMRVKFCGITRIEDAREAVRLGAWAIGLNHWAGEPTPLRSGDRASRSAPSCGARSRSSACSSTPTLEEVASAVEDEELSMIQLHGDEGPAFCQEARPAHRRQGDQGDPRAQRGRHPGGRGLPHRLSPARRAPAGRPGRHRRELRLGAGPRPPTGDPDDPRRRPHPRQRRRARSRSRRPFAVDVASGIEAGPGIKDHALMAAFAERAQGRRCPRPGPRAR